MLTGVDALASRILGALDRDGSGAIDGAEIGAFLADLEGALSATPSLDGAVAARYRDTGHPAHDLKVLVNDTLVAAARELGLELGAVDGARYPAVAALRPGVRPDGGLEGPTPEQAAIRRRLTERVAAILARHPDLPPGVEVRVENPDAPSGADRIALRLADGSGELVFDVITGAGILKARIAKDYLARKDGVAVETAHGRQLDLLGRIADRVAAAFRARRAAGLQT